MLLWFILKCDNIGLDLVCECRISVCKKCEIIYIFNGYPVKTDSHADKSVHLCHYGDIVDYDAMFCTRQMTKRLSYGGLSQ